MAPSINLQTYPLSPRFHHLCSIRRSIKRTYTLALIAAILLILYLALQSLIPSQPPIPTLQTTNLTTPRAHSSIRIAKATIAYAPSNSVYARSLALHASQSYETHVLRTPLVKGFANTLLWLQHVITSELLKDENERAEWILFFSPSVVVANTLIPLHTFLPPLASPEFDHIHVLGTKSDDGEEMNCEMFFMRVSPLSLRLLVLAVAAVHVDARRDWGKDIVGAALQYVLEQDEYRDKVVWQPGKWYDGAGAAFMQVKGLLVMRGVMQRVYAPVEEVPSKDEIGEFWDTFRNATLVLREAGYRGHTSVQGEFAVWVRALKEWVELRTWDVEGIRERMEVLKGKLGIGDIIGYGMNFG
ncbi:hypothetical protein HBH56_059530 [Parastagonospora nodorum]|uniref:Uncharacterized protein n=2 Tax=Phaeosphaeria nodorum (strain SN15 / ATCC MYA-4574 / FGSC 10173) TaxID=321614 RepID=A0A7U2HU06_PHANO|nr:hypothetical protein SNOG_02010 [Parastagonospora nodorum SN15]KAH3916511.1 hypothetical protein HBH56_059530 [Parastagonospora nodorum]EAT90222.1 hypothetical protein SNOG_02010 [Parastagonospora nodorum SN15]KAH3930944.1 hypothetical protein HBH54_103460 [Parastagonospora nodorum]KAH3977370.1 hypothetical protein HBH52_112530 [Parastagonospora nodorum]KAH4140841.1 hypothetical protein HBH45_078300 [Parastagonospora nodorum]